MATLKQCDRCKLVADPWKIKRIVTARTKYDDNVQFDLCEACGDKIIQVLNDGGKQ